MRSAKEQEFFPYDAKTVCYILVTPDGNVQQVHHTADELKKAHDDAKTGDAALYAVWPGKWRSDLFVIDDLDAFADAVGIDRQDQHVHDIEWEISSRDDGTARYASVECRLKCGCSIWKMGIKKFSNDMRRQLGWDVATSRGCSGSGDVFSVSVRRSSIKQS